MAVWESIVAFLVSELLPWAISILAKWLEEHFNPNVSEEGWVTISKFFQDIYDEAGEKGYPKAQWAVTEIFAKMLPIAIVIPADITPVVGDFFHDLADKAVAEHKANVLKIPYFPKSVEWVDEEPDWRDDGGG